jgi:hypothetical protein
MARPNLPEGLSVEYAYDESDVTPAGRALVLPHRRTTAIVKDATGKEVARGEALCRSGPTRDEIRGVGYDHFAKQIGRDIALGRALKALHGKFYTTKEMSA